VNRDLAIGLSMLAATVHAWLAPGHFDQAWWLGAGFAGSAAVQTGWALAALSGPPPRWGLICNLVFVAVWAVSRTVGLPGLPVEPVGVLDVLTVGAELSLCGMLAGLRTQKAGLAFGASLLCVLASGMGAH
jgi:hypothetical protein